MAARRRHSWQTLRRWTAAAGVAALALGLCGALQVFRDYDRLPPLPEIADLSLSAVVLDRQDRLLRAFTSRDDKWRLPVDLEAVDPLYFKLLLAFEDKRFYRHRGFDLWAFLRSALQSVRAGRIVSGGSTLTMQVARLLDETPTRTVKRKYEQLLKAVRLERTFTKDEILHFYALRAPFGGNLEGVRAASLTWFGKEPRRLTPAEAALLVALPQSPETRRPDRSPEAARVARNRVLARAEAAGVLSADEVSSASAEPVRAERHRMPLLAAHESREARFEYPGTPVYRLTLDRDLQEAVEALARRKVVAFPPPISMAILVADHQNGEILASVGAPDLLDTVRLGHVDMTRAVRSPGSTLKPLIYGLAFEEGIGLPESLIEDRPTDIGGYRPANFDQAYQGTVTLREALQLSLNTPAVQLLEAVGPARLIARLKRAGVRPVLEKGTEPGLAIGLGGLGLSLRDLTQTYAALARGGKPVTLSTCKNPCAQEAEPPRSMPMLSEKAAYLVSDVLSGMPQIQGARSHSLAYKTGTAYGYRDSWAAGYDGRHVVAVWVGRPDGSPVPGQTGAKTAVPILFDVFQKLGSDRVPLPPAPQEAFRSAASSAPKALSYARVKTRPAAGRPGKSLEIAYPPEGAVLDLGWSREGARAETPLVVKVRGGNRPFVFLVNGVPQTSGSFDSQLIWYPDARGFADVTVLDARGSAARVAIELK
ncbi:penicillin-binding protein 1C [Roseibium aggregatum]|uniref:peptidoglycan glycosyltransferase n=1 Tax=Roseibium aggregatum TaxID=187304 RepID=A0A939EBP6_9HYPH|nr:penicillin-binding protein 1C [Roseibium aggregatum]MBN9669801.1 penicillin-binding protein 1C [Roseibium aggregatum]